MNDLLQKVYALFNGGVQYFNPQSNAGNNFWSTPTAKTLGNIQTTVQQAVNQTPFANPSVNNGQNFWSSPVAQGMANVQQSVVQPFANFFTQPAAQRSQQINQFVDTISPPKFSPIGLPNMITNPITKFAGNMLLADQYKPPMKPFSQWTDQERQNNLNIAMGLSGGMENKAAGRIIPSTAENIASKFNPVSDAKLLSSGLPEEVQNIVHTYPRTLSGDSRALLKSGFNMSEGDLNALQTKITNAYKQTGISDADAVQLLKQSNPGGLMNESLAQTAFRREQNLTPQQVYTPALEQKIKTFVSNAFKRNDPSGVQRLQQMIDPEFTKVTKKVNLLDYMRTPTNVLEKIGLGEQAKVLRNSYESYLNELPKEIAKIQEWMKQVPDKGSSETIFNYLDGKPTTISPAEQKVADEIKVYLKDWAVKLNLPEEKRVSTYITHLFQKGSIEAEFNDEIAKLIDRQVAGSVYNPFMQARIKNELPYIHDVWRALDAYVKRGVRAYNMDPALKILKDSSNKLELSQINYVERLTARINMRPQELDTLIDNWIKSSPIGYRLGGRPVTAISRAIRQQIYRGAIGLNFSSALRNLTQFSNTYAKLGEKWTAIGYVKLFRNWNSGELEAVGVLRNSFIEDQTVSVFKTALKKLDEGLFYLFEQAEKINRGAAYYGAKAKFLSQGVAPEEAVKQATETVRQTQFAFSPIDTPLAMQGDLVKLLTQLQSFGVKQVEFLAGMAKNKEWLGLLRYIGSTLVIAKVFHDRLGMQVDPLPQFSSSPAVQVAQNVGPAIFGNDQAKADAQKKLLSVGAMLIPGGIQAKKTITGLTDYSKGYVQSASGAVRYPVEKNTPNLIKGGLFGTSSFPETQQYYDSGAVLGKKQSSLIKSQDNATALKSYQDILSQRANDKQLTQVKDMVFQTTVPTWFGQTYVYLNKDTGTVSTITPSIPTPPKLTGQTELDKKLVSKYKSAITREENDIATLFEQGAIKQDEAEKQLIALKALYNTTGTSSGTKKIASSSIKGISIKKPKLASAKFGNIKIKAPPRIKGLKAARFTHLKATKLSKVKPIKVTKSLKTIASGLFA